MRSRDIFEHQTQQYRDSVLPHHIEQASTFGWERYIGPSGRVIE
jgi:transketolase